MQDRPTLIELLESVRRFLEEEVVTSTRDPRLRFRARVAANVLAIAGRETVLEEDLLAAERGRLRELLEVEEPAPTLGSLADLRREVAELTSELARRIRAGLLAAEPGGAVFRHLLLSAEEKLRVASPGYLERRGEAT